jgi:hypothetical protein
MLGLAGGPHVAEHMLGSFGILPGAGALQAKVKDGAEHGAHFIRQWVYVCYGFIKLVMIHHLL